MRDKLASSKNRAVARAAKVGATLFARHADIYAKAYSKATGKPYTALDYMRDRFGLDVDGTEVEANADGLKQSAPNRENLSDAERKDLQFRIIQEMNPMRDDIHTGVRSPEDILAAKEAFQSKTDEDSYAYPDFTKADGIAALKRGSVTVYSSHPILPGAFVTPSRMQAKDYAGGGKVYSARVPIEDVAWLHSDEGQYAPLEWNGFDQRAWHGTPHKFKKFDLGAIGTGEGAQVHGWGLYFAQQKSVGEGYREGLTGGKWRVSHGDEVYEFDYDTGDLIHEGTGSLMSNDDPEALAIEAFIGSNADKYEALNILENALEDKRRMFFPGEALDEEVGRIEDAIELLENEWSRFDVEPSGSLFQVEIPDNDVLLDEQLSFDKQPEKVQEALKRIADEMRSTKEGSPEAEFAENYRKMNGKKIYEALTHITSDYEDASRLLNNHGIKGITYDGQRDGRCFVIFDDEAIEIIEEFNQRMNSIRKGSITPQASGRRIISLFEQADESTFLHEMGHMFLMDLEDLAAIDEASVEDLETVRDWAAWQEGQAKEYEDTPWQKEFAEREKAILAAKKRGDVVEVKKLKREWEQEHFARGFERYLETGKAPTSVLKRIFLKFKKFLERIYQAFKGTGGKASPEVEAVMGRMIAEEEQGASSEFEENPVQEKSAPIPADFSASKLKGAIGKTVSIATDSGEEIPVRYRLVEAKSLITSNSAKDFTRNPRYPKTLQPRDRERANMQQQIREMASRLRPEDLAESRSVNLGAPVVRADGVVLNGNGRAIAITRALLGNTFKDSTGKGYRAFLKENAASFGFSPEAVTKMHALMLVREVTGGLNEAQVNAVISSTNDGGGVVVTGKEFGEYRDIKDLRKKAIAYYQEHLQGTSVENARLGKVDIDKIGLVEFTGSGKREVKSTSAREEKLFLVKYLPQLIRDATDITEKAAQKERHATDHFYYLHTSATINGEAVPVDITLVKRNDGHIQFFNHVLPTLEQGNKNEPSVSARPESSKEALGTSPVDGSSTATIPPAAEEIKKNPATTLDALFQEAPALKNAALEYGATEKDGKVTFENPGREKEFLRIADALQGDVAKKLSAGKSVNNETASIERGERAVRQVLNSKRNVPNAMYRKEIGGIDFLYGKAGDPAKKFAGGYGIAHILAKHGQEAVDMIPTVIARGKMSQKYRDRVYFSMDHYMATVRLDFDGQKRTWLVTNFEKYANKKDSPATEDFARSAANSDGASSTVGGNLSLASTISSKEAEDKGSLKNEVQEEKFSARRQEALSKVLQEVSLIAPEKLSKRQQGIADFGKEMGMPVVFFHGAKNLHGFHAGNGVTFLNVDSETSLPWTFWHEALHWMKANNEGLFKDIIRDVEQAGTFTKAQLDGYRKEIGAFDLSDAEVIEEMLADALPDVKRRVPFMKDLGKRDRSLAERFVGWIREVMDRFRDFFAKPGVGLTKAQSTAMRNAFAALARDMVDERGRRIFRVNEFSRRITLANGAPLPSAKYSLDNRERRGDNEDRISKAVFDKHLNDGIMKMVEERVRKEIGEHVDFAAMSDPVARDAARDGLPYIKDMLTKYNQLKGMKAKLEYLNRQAVKIEYARRCFDNDERIRNEAVRRVVGVQGQGAIHRADVATLPAGGQGESRSNGRRAGLSRSVSGERSGARAHFEQLYEEMKKHPETGAFSMAKFDRLSIEEPLLAPNGKPSNLTKEQYEAVRTPAFKAWFGDWEHDPANASKVVDENGEPLVVYHATLSDFTKFRPSEDGMYGKGIYLTADKEDTSYTLQDEEWRVLELFANIRNPRDPEAMATREDIDATKKEALEFFKKHPFDKDGTPASFVVNNLLFWDMQPGKVKKSRLTQILKDAFARKGVTYRESGKHDGAIIRRDGATWYTAFKPNQVKSATNNIGAYNTNEDDIRFSVKFSRDNSKPGSMGRFRKLLVGLKIGEAAESNLEVHRSNKEKQLVISASKLNQFMADKSLTEKNILKTEDVGGGKIRVTYMPQDFRNVPKTVKEFRELTKNENDRKLVTSILLEGDAAGKEYGVQELRALGANANVIKAYQLVRRTMREWYKRVNDARMQVETRTKTLSKNDLADFKKNHWIKDSDVLSVEEKGGGKVLLTWRGGKTYETKDKVMTKTELDALLQDKDINVAHFHKLNDSYGVENYSVDYVERIKPLGNLTGYIPHFFHEWMVYEKHKDPKTGEVRLTTIGSGRSMNDAVRLGNEIARQNSDKEYVVQPKGFDLNVENSVVIGDVDFQQMAAKLADETQMTLADANAFLRDSAGATIRARHRFFGNAMHRKGAKGFDTDITYVLTHYLNTSARYIAMEQFKPRAISLYERWFGAFDVDPKLCGKWLLERPQAYGGRHENS